jgi:glycosyltransferase involved in cell wall biosynthesis
VIVPLHNYGHYLPEALDSVRAQTLPALDLVVVDDASTDDSLAVARAWMERHAGRFNRALLLRNQANAGLALTRNVGFAAAETPFVLQLDADNKLLADCAEHLLAAIRSSGAAFAYPTLQQFGDGTETLSDRAYDPIRLAGGNYIDATALVRLSAWAAIGGYEHMAYGWEDYDAWCRFAERGLYGHHVPEVLALYRVHGRSMLRTVTDVAENRRRLMAAIRLRHPWVFEGAVAV